MNKVQEITTPPNHQSWCKTLSFIILWMMTNIFYFKCSHDVISLSNLIPRNLGKNVWKHISLMCQSFHLVIVSNWNNERENEMKRSLVDTSVMALLNTYFTTTSPPPKKKTFICVKHSKFSNGASHFSVKFQCPIFTPFVLRMQITKSFFKWKDAHIT